MTEIPLPAWAEPLPDAEQQRAIDAWAIEQRGIPGIELMERAGPAWRSWSAARAPSGRWRWCVARATTAATGWWPPACCANRAARSTCSCSRIPTSSTATPGPTSSASRGPARPFDAGALQGRRGHRRRDPRDRVLGRAARARRGRDRGHQRRGWRRAVIVACDVPSGVDASTGEMAGAPSRADATATFHAGKPGLWIAPARRTPARSAWSTSGSRRRARSSRAVGLIDGRPRRDLPGAGASRPSSPPAACSCAEAPRAYRGALHGRGGRDAGRRGLRDRVRSRSLNLVFELRLLEVMTVPCPTGRRPDRGGGRHGARARRACRRARARARAGARGRNGRAGPDDRRASRDPGAARRRRPERPRRAADALAGRAGRHGADAPCGRAGAPARARERRGRARTGWQRARGGRAARARSWCSRAMTRSSRPGRAGGDQSWRRLGAGHRRYRRRPLGRDRRAAGQAHGPVPRRLRGRVGPRRAPARSRPADRGRGRDRARRDRAAAGGAGTRAHADADCRCARWPASTWRRSSATSRTLRAGCRRDAAVRGRQGRRYGHGAVPAARAALAGGAQWLAVATAGEAAELRAARRRAAAGDGRAERRGAAGGARRRAPRSWPGARRSCDAWPRRRRPAGRRPRQARHRHGPAGHARPRRGAGRGRAVLSRAPAGARAGR